MGLNDCSPSLCCPRFPRTGVGLGKSSLGSLFFVKAESGFSLLSSVVVGIERRFVFLDELSHKILKEKVLFGLIRFRGKYFTVKRPVYQKD